MGFGLGILISTVQSANSKSNSKYLPPTSSYILPITFPLSSTALTLLLIEKVIFNSSLLHFIQLKS